jgi:hypothetical protein
MIISGTTIRGGLLYDGPEPSGLYNFTTFTFTNAAATGNIGPTLSNCLSSYDTISNTWLNNTSYFNVIGGVQYWTVPQTGNYTVEAWGANGAASSNTRVGKGAYVKGTFTLTQGEIIRIAVGQQGFGNVFRKDYPGGGGSFVVRSTFDSNASILTIAGGGGGVASDASGNITLAAGAITTWGNTSGDGKAGGQAGNGTGSLNQTVQGGAGFFTNGYVLDGVTNAANDVSRPRSFTNASPVLGGYVYWSGSGTSPGLPGGFGGGGGTDRFQPPSTALNALGGGGGYSGGAGAYSTGYVAGGGGSYNTGTSQTMTSNVRLGHGQVIITKI